MKHLKIIAVAICALALVIAALGWYAMKRPTRLAPTHLVVIGNSLTLIPADGRGLVTTDAAHDYAHLVAAGLGLPLRATNVADLERTPFETSAHLIAPAVAGIDKRTAVIVELGDNAPHAGSPNFTTAYRALLDATKDASSLTCVSTWWKDDTKDAMMRDTCTERGGRFVFIGDIYPTRSDVIDPKGDRGVEEHPHDPSMAIIARRVLETMKAAT